MSTLARLERRLLTLAAEDRAWILEQLSTTTTGGDHSTPFERSLDRAALEAASPECVAEVLAAEPTWISAVVLDGADGRWRRRVWRALPRPVRRRVQSLQRQGIGASPRMRAAACDAVVQAAARTGGQR